MKRGCLPAVVFLLAVTLAPAPALTIKLGSLAPAGSPWELGLKRVAAEWERISGGTVSVKIYSGGVAGDEPDMVRKIRIGTLNAGGYDLTARAIFNKAIVGTGQVNFTVVPEPSISALFGIIGVSLLRRRRHSRTAALP